MKSTNRGIDTKHAAHIRKVVSDSDLAQEPTPVNGYNVPSFVNPDVIQLEIK